MSHVINIAIQNIENLSITLNGYKIVKTKSNNKNVTANNFNTYYCKTIISAKSQFRNNTININKALHSKN